MKIFGQIVATLLLLAASVGCTAEAATDQSDQHTFAVGSETMAEHKVCGVWTRYNEGSFGPSGEACVTVYAKPNGNDRTVAAVCGRGVYAVQVASGCK